jgi:hypothetical protein
MPSRQTIERSLVQGVNGIGRGRKEEGKASFLKKRSKKLSLLLGVAVGGLLGRSDTHTGFAANDGPQHRPKYRYRGSAAPAAKLR